MVRDEHRVRVYCVDVHWSFDMELANQGRSIPHRNSLRINRRSRAARMRELSFMTFGDVWIV